MLDLNRQLDSEEMILQAQCEITVNVTSKRRRLRPLHVLLLGLAAASASAVAEAERGIRYSPDVTDDDTFFSQATESEVATGLLAALNEYFQRSSERLQSFFRFTETDNAIRIVVIEQEKEDPAVARKTACLKAVEIIHEQEEVHKQTDTLIKYIRSAFDMVSLHVWGGASCDDLVRPELVDQCNLVVKSEVVVQKFLREGKTDDQVCDIVSAVLDLDTTDNLSCQLCQRFVQMVDQALSQEVQEVEQVREIIGDLCNAMSTESMCHTFLKNYDAIVDWVKHDTDALVVCSRLAMCLAGSSSSDISDLAWTPEELSTIEDGALVTADLQVQEQSCLLCTRVTKVIYQVNIMFSDELPRIKSLLASVCQMVSSVSKCQKAEANFDRVVELVQVGQHPYEICVNADFCPKKTLLDMLQILNNDKACVYCDAATTVMEVILQEAPEQMNEIREYADMICSILGDDSPCHQYVTQMDTVIDSLKKGAHPRDICKMLKYCSADRVNREESSRVGMMQNGRLGNHHSVSMSGSGGRHERVDNGLHGVMAMTQIGEERLPHPPRCHHGSCFFCMRVAVVIHQVNRASSEKLSIVKTILSNVCPLVPSKFECDVVDKNFEKIVELEKEGKHPHEICKSLGVCKMAQDGKEYAPSIADDVEDVTAVLQFLLGSETQCTYCQFATTVAKIAVEQYGADIREVRAYADMICDMLGEDNPCHVYVKQFDFVIDSIAKGMTSNAICVGLKFCTANIVDTTNAATQIAEYPPVVEGVQEEKLMSVGCLFCEFTADLVEYAKDSEKALREAKVTLETMCTVLPPLARCDVLSSKFDELLALMREGNSPSEACHAIALCDADFVFSPTPNLKEDPIVRVFEQARQSMSNAVEVQ